MFSSIKANAFGTIINFNMPVLIVGYPTLHLSVQPRLSAVFQILASVLLVVA